MRLKGRLEEHYEALLQNSTISIRKIMAFHIIHDINGMQTDPKKTGSSKIIHLLQAFPSSFWTMKSLQFIHNDNRRFFTIGFIPTSGRFSQLLFIIIIPYKFNLSVSRGFVDCNNNDDNNKILLYNVS